MARNLRTAPLGSDRLGWHAFYARQYDKHVRAGRDPAQAAHLSLWYLFLHFAGVDTHEHTH